MKRFMFAAAVAVLAAGSALAEDAASLRDPAIASCTSSAKGSPQEAQSTQICTCMIDGVIAKMPGDDAVKILKLFIANPTTDAETAAALGVSEDEAKAYMEKQAPVLGEAMMACMPQQ